MKAVFYGIVLENKKGLRGMKTVKKAENIMHLFEGWSNMVLPYLHGCMGQAWTDDEDNPRMAIIDSAGFIFLSGDASLPHAKDFLAQLPTVCSYTWVDMIPRGHTWHEIIEDVFQENQKKFTRYAIKHEHNFNKEKLRGYIDTLPSDYKIVPMDEELFNFSGTQDWSKDFFAGFKSFTEFKEHGLGYMILHGDTPVCGASSCTYYKGGIEIEIDTVKEYRQKGLATACAAQLILECLNKGIYPSWDAANKISVALAEKLGYIFDKAYDAYDVKLRD